MFCHQEPMCDLSVPVIFFIVFYFFGAVYLDFFFFCAEAVKDFSVCLFRLSRFVFLNMDRWW